MGINRRGCRGRDGIRDFLVGKVELVIRSPIDETGGVVADIEGVGFPPLDVKGAGVGCAGFEGGGVGEDGEGEGGC